MSRISGWRTRSAGASHSGSGFRKKTEDEDEDAEHEWGEWALRAHSPIDAATVAERLPQPLMLWVRRRTEQAVDLFDELEAEGPGFAAAARRVKAELEALP